MRKFEGHIHTFLFKVPVRESISLFQRQFDRFGVEKARFLALPCDPIPGKIELDQTDRIDNIRAMYFKAAFAPNGYAYAGLEYCGLDLKDTSTLSQALQAQVQQSKAVGYDGIKMFEGHPNHRKCLGYPLDHNVFDPFFDFCEREQFPIIMHLSNPPEFWDADKVTDYWKERGCYFDETYPSFDALHQEILRRLEKNPTLHLTLAHWGFLTCSKEVAEQYFSYPNTGVDVCPGSDYAFNILKDVPYWTAFIEKHIDRIVYGTDCYNFEYDNEENWLTATGRRPSFVEHFFTTTDTFEFQGQTCRGIGLRTELCEKLFFDNLERMMGTPKPIDFEFFIKKCEQLLQEEPVETLEHYNLWCMVNDFRHFQMR